MVTTPDRGVLRFITCGSVDDGKSTLIGRLLFDTKSVLADALSALERTSRKRGSQAVDLSLITDGLQAEREQGITIDVAYRYFATGARKYILGDAPGHEQYTRNMVTAASTADLAVVLVDARQGVLAQTRRHTMLASLMGVRQFVIAVNKMDLAGWSREVFEGIREAFLAFARDRGLTGLQFIPLSALLGDGVVAPGEHMPWYGGPTLLELLERAPLTQEGRDRPFRLPVQWVCLAAPGAAQDTRGYAGRVESGELEVGDELLVMPSGRRGRVRDIRLGEERLARCQAGQGVMLFLEDAIDIGRGDLLASPAAPPAVGTGILVRLCWLGEKPARAGDRFLLRHGTRDVRVRLKSVASRLNIQTLEMERALHAAMNDIVEVALELQAPIAFDCFGDAAKGALILIDEASNETVAGGLILACPAEGEMSVA
jgi:sulfate adenylyltransferase subunit 1